jgi:hypothetical protein
MAASYLDYFIHAANILLLITAKPLVGVEEAMGLLQRSIKSE